jgi:glycosyltransferase involved in cell wall biosynthesis
LSVEISVVVPVKDEAGNVIPLLREIATALEGESAEIIFVDDASGDETSDQLKSAQGEFPQLRILRHELNCGQSAAIRTGVMAARGRLIVTIDGDGQNDPADIPALLKRYRDPQRQPDVTMVTGQRAKRQDIWSKRWASRFANNIRRSLLKDDTQDTGCGLKVIEREAYLRLPYFDHMHRYMPALLKREGMKVDFVKVNHRPRGSGKSKYTNLQRGLVSIRDMMGVMWLMSRKRRSGNVREL